MSPEAPQPDRIIGPPPAAPEIVVPESVVPAPELVILPPPPVSEVAPVEVPAPIELLPIPEGTEAAREERLRIAAEQQAADAAHTAEIARGIVEGFPGTLATAETPVEQPLTNGRSNNGIIPVDMPPDPTHVVGWNGDVKRS